MIPTRLLYLEDFSALECEAKVLEALRENERDVLILDQTMFYPQGGGQPYDKGVIELPSGRFIVEEVRFVDGVVKHIGRFERGAFAKGETVELRVDETRRTLNSRLHSAGHLLDLAVTELNLGWTPGKGYHFPDGPYVEYQGSVDNADREKLQHDIEAKANEAIKKGQEVTARFMEKDEMRSVCHFVPDYIPTDKPGRVVLFGSFGVPCGGTHVKNLSEINSMTIRKIKAKGDTIQVGYDVVRS